MQAFHPGLSSPDAGTLDLVTTTSYFKCDHTRWSYTSRKMKKYIQSFFSPTNGNAQEERSDCVNEDTADTQNEQSPRIFAPARDNKNNTAKHEHNKSRQRKAVKGSFSLRAPTATNTFGATSPRSRPRLLSRSGPMPNQRHISGSACGMSKDELNEHVELLRTSRHTFLPHLANILRKLMDSSQNRGIFNEPVTIPGYTDIVETPIDLRVVRSRLVSGEYNSIESFSNDVHLVFDNAMQYNPPGHVVHKCAKDMKLFFEELKLNAYQRMNEEEQNPLLRVVNTRTDSSTTTRSEKSKNKTRSKKAMKKSSKNNNQVTTEANTSMLSQERKNGTNARRETSFYSTQPTNDNTSSTNKSDTSSIHDGIGNQAAKSVCKNVANAKNNVDFASRPGLKCSLCNSGDLVLSIPVLRCGAPCNSKIARGANYYIAPTASPEGLSQHWCQRCYNNLPNEFSALYGQQMKKADLIPCKNDEVFLEKWIQCGSRRQVTGPAHLRRCGKVMHMACALYMPTTRVPLIPPYRGLGWSTTNSNSSNGEKEHHTLNADEGFQCPECMLRDSDSQWDKHSIPRSTSTTSSVTNKCITIKDWHAGYSLTHDYSAAALPESSLSKRVERRIRRRIHSEAILEGGTYSREEATDFLSNITVRALAGEHRKLARWPRVARWVEAQKELYGSMQLNNFSYRPIAVFLFQRLSGTDICLFAMYVHEYGTPGEKSPNRRKAYVSYLDSTNYMQPSVFRTPTYHEIMLGYVEDAKVRGFDSIYIWACPPPPRAGDSYILNCHPKWQRTPNTERLIKWYKTIENRAKEEGLVVETTDFLASHFFGHRAYRQTRGSISSSRRRASSAATKTTSSNQGNNVAPVLPEWGKGGRPSNFCEIPHFSGDFWPAEAESILRELEGFNEIEDDPDEGMRNWWQELTRRELDRGKPSKKRKAEVLKEPEKDVKPWSKFDRSLVAKLPQGSSSINGSSGTPKRIKVKAKIMEIDIQWILKRRETDRRLWQEHVRKMRKVKPKPKVVIPDVNSRESWIMSRVAARLGPMKEHHLVWHLRHKCFGCLKHLEATEVMYRYELSPALSKTNEHFMCEQCHKKKGQKDLFAFRYNRYRKRKSIELKVREIAPDNTILRKSPGQSNFYGSHIPTVSRSSIFDTRMALLAYLQRMSFQFDQLRRAKHSSMMILYHLHSAMTRDEKDLPDLPPGLSLSDQVYQ